MGQRPPSAAGLPLTPPPAKYGGPVGCVSRAAAAERGRVGGRERAVRKGGAPVRSALPAGRCGASAAARTPAPATLVPAADARRARRARKKTPRAGPAAKRHISTYHRPAGLVSSGMMQGGISGDRRPDRRAGRGHPRMLHVFHAARHTDCQAPTQPAPRHSSIGEPFQQQGGQQEGRKACGSRPASCSGPARSWRRSRRQQAVGELSQISLQRCWLPLLHWARRACSLRRFRVPIAISST